MKRRTGIFIMAIMLIGIACCLIYSRKDTAEAESAVYQDLLAEYERALRIRSIPGRSGGMMYMNGWIITWMRNVRYVIVSRI